MFPETVPVLESVGCGRYEDNGSPCCAIGHALAVFRCDLGQCRTHPRSLEGVRFRNAYSRCARALGIPDNTVEYINDTRADSKERALLFNAAMAYLGYTEGQDPEANKLARKARRNQ